MHGVGRSYGVLGREQRFEWLIKKGDLAISNRTNSMESKSFWHNVRSSNGWKHKFEVFSAIGDSYLDDDDDLPETWQEGQKGMHIAFSIL